MPTIAETLARAKVCHLAGDLASAEHFYRQLIQADPANVEAHFLLGTACYGLGKASEAITSLAHAIRLQPDHAEAHNHLGAALAHQGKLDEAILSLQQAYRLRPGSAEISENLRLVLAANENSTGHALGAQGKLVEAAAHFRRAVELKPGLAEAHNGLGVVLEKQGRLSEAANCYRQAIQLQPDFAEAYHNLGVVLERQGGLDPAAACYRRAVELRPAYAAAHNALGTVLAKQEKFDEALACFRRAVELKPDYYEAHTNLGVLSARQGDLDEAVICYRRALELNPDYAEAHNNLGAAFGMKENLVEARACFRRAVELKPDYPQVYNNLSVVLEKQGSLDESAACARRALDMNPDDLEAHNNLGAALTRQGKTDEALACFRKALEAQPRFVTAHSNILLALQYQPGTTLAQLAAAHREYDERHAAPLRATWRPHDNEPNPDRRLRVGFVSADFGFHPVGYFLVRVLKNLDGRQVETTCYSSRPKADAMTGRLRAAATNWRDVHARNDQQLADQIRADRIDILFDLAGHTRNNRLLVFARKPAPIQITWLGYVGTTGLEAMDYLLADRYEVPEGAEPYFRERVLRLPEGYACYDPPGNAPEVSPLPALERGHVTFGSFNNLAKITPNVVDLWAKVLRRVTLSRLVLKYSGLDAPSVTRRMEEMFGQRGVERGRLELLGKSSHEDLLRQYQRVDIALDPFPYNGGLTTCEALWMGVPVVTCPGETFAGRHSLSHLSNVGLLETIAGDLEEYVELAAGLAADLPRLAGIRARLRDQMAGSRLCDGQRFAENFTTILRAAWRQWCDDRPSE